MRKLDFSGFAALTLNTTWKLSKVYIPW